jgi:putative ATP-binding cassette transporter
MRWRALRALTLIVALVLSLNGLNVANSYVGREFMTAVADRESQRYVVFALLYVAVFAGSTVVAVLYKYAQDRLALLWRVWLSKHLIDGYLAGDTFYRIQLRDEVDNPDQRITEDVKIFTDSFLSFLLMLVNSAMTAIAFATVLWLITPWLFVATVLYAACGSLITIYLGRRLPGLDNLQLKKEADLRYNLARLREYAEPITLLQGNANENTRLKSLLTRLAENYKQVIAVTRNVSFFTSGYNYLVQIIPVLIVAPSYVRGDVEFGTVTQSAMAFAQLLGALSLIVAQFQSISAFAAVVTRLGLLQGALSQQSAPRRPIQIVEDDSRIAYEDLTLKTPDHGRVLIKDLSLQIERGRRVLISEKHGAGKSALFRATAGLWVTGEGRIVRPPLAQVMFLPQRPYVVPGSLREQLLYGLAPEKNDDERIHEVIRTVGLETVLKRIGGLDDGCDWCNAISQGEEQLFAIARLLLANPAFAFLDQSVSALTIDRGKRIYRILAATDITYVSIGDRPFLQDFHETLLELSDGGRWRQSPCRELATV